MATTAKGTPYVVSTDLVANYPTVSSDLADHIDDNLAYNAVSINAQTGTTYTFALADASEGKLVTASNAAASTYTVPPQSSVTWANGAVLRILNQGAGVVTIAAGAGVTINGTPLTLAQYKGAAIQRTASNTWTFVPFSGGVGNADFSDAATGTYTSGGVNYKYISYTASGTLTVTTAGFADILVIGGGGGGATAYNGGGAGGHLEVTDAYLPSGTLTLTVGAGGAGPAAEATTFRAGITGNASRLGSYYGVGGGGGGGGESQSNGQNGGSGGGGSGNGISGQGNNGGARTAFAGAGGGGASATGAANSGNNGGAGGAGLANSYTGSSVTRSGGGGGGVQGGNTAGSGGTGGGGNGSSSTVGSAGGANTGGGGGGGAYASSTHQGGGAGGSGVVIVRVKV